MAIKREKKGVDFKQGGKDRSYVCCDKKEMIIEREKGFCYDKRTR
jgi:hypothetical protein